MYFLSFYALYPLILAVSYSPFWVMYEKAFAAGTPSFGSCWGMQTAAVALGGETKAGPNGVEVGFARAIRPADHPMMAGRRDGFDALAMHRDDVTRAPEGAVVTASNDHTAVQAFAYEAGDADFWGVQYHPECRLRDVAHWLGRTKEGPWKDGGKAVAGKGQRILGIQPEALHQRTSVIMGSSDEVDRVVEHL